MDFEIEKIIRQNRKTINISVTNNGKLLIKAPKNVSDSEIFTLITKNQKKIQKIQKHHLDILENKFKLKENQKIYFLGNEYLVKLNENYQLPTFIEDKVYISSKTSETELKEIFIKFFKKEAEKNFKKRLLIYSKLMNLEYEKFRLSNAKTRWGTCNSKKTIAINWRLIMAPQSVIDSVIVHELAHLKHPNHSKEFWKTVLFFFPDYQNAKNWLKNNTAKLQMFDF